VRRHNELWVVRRQQHLLWRALRFYLFGFDLLAVKLPVRIME
jgi:hypothetical protein